MKRLLYVDHQAEAGAREEWWRSKNRKRSRGLFIRSGKTSKIASPGLLLCAQCGSEVKVLVSPRRNPHSSKIGRAVSMKDHDLCRRCWRGLIQQSRQETVISLNQNPRFTGENLQLRTIDRHELPKTGS